MCSKTTSGKQSIISIAEYIASKSVLAEDYVNEDSWSYISEYDEEKDYYWTTEGFYEWCYESETSWKLTENVIHWMPLPEFPQEAI